MTCAGSWLPGWRRAGVLLAVMWGSACTNAPSTSSPSVTADANIALARRSWTELWDSRNLAVIPELYTVDHRSYTNGVLDSIPGSAGVEARVRQLQTQYPDGQLAVEDVFATDDKVASRWVWTATDPQTKKPLSVAGLTVSRIVDGKIAEAWATYDLLAPTLAAGATINPPPGVTTTGQ